MFASSIPQIDLKKPLTTIFEIMLFNGIIIYGTSKVVVKLASVIEDFAELWMDKGDSVELPQQD